MIMRHEEKEKMETVQVKKINLKNEIEQNFHKCITRFSVFYTDNSDFPDQLWYNWLNEYAYSRYAGGTKLSWLEVIG